MKNTINLLEKMGSCANFSGEALDIASLASNIDKETLDIIKSKDQKQLDQLLDLRHKIVCILIPAKEDDEEENDKDDEDDKDSKTESRVVNF